MGLCSKPKKSFAAMDSSAKRARTDEGGDEPARTLTSLGVTQFAHKTRVVQLMNLKSWVGNRNNHQRTRPPAQLFPPGVLSAQLPL